MRPWHQPSVYIGPKPFTSEKLEVWGEEMNDLLNEACGPPLKKKTKAKNSQTENHLLEQIPGSMKKKFSWCYGVRTLIGFNS